MQTKWPKLRRLGFGVCVALLIAILAEYVYRIPESRSLDGVGVSVISVEYVYLDTFVFFENGNQGSVFLEIDYSNVPLEPDEVVSKVYLDGIVVHGDGHEEAFSQSCTRRGSIDLHNLPDTTTTTFSTEVDNSPLCFVMLRHSIRFDNEIVPYWGWEFDEQRSYVRSVALSGRMTTLNGGIEVRKRPTKIELQISEKFNDMIDALLTPFRRY